MSAQRLPIEPIETRYQLRFLSDEQLDALQQATLQVLEETGVQFPSPRALDLFEQHGADVNRETSIVKLPRDLVFKALSTAPRYPLLAARDPLYDLQMAPGKTFITSDGCGHETIDFYTGERRASTKADLAMMSRVGDYLPAISFVWSIVSAQDCGLTAPLHEISAAWDNSVKHYQSVTLMGETRCRYGVEMAAVLSGSREEMRRRPSLSCIICTIAPLIQDKAGIEGAMVLAAAGLPVVFLSMPTIGTTAPATYAGSLVIGDAENISAAVLMQLVNPGAPVFHSIMHAWADPRTAAYVGYPLDQRARTASVEIAHHWGLPSLGSAFGTESAALDDWRSAAEVTIDPLLAGLAGAEIVTGVGLRDTYTLLYPEAIILDVDIYQRARYHLKDVEINPETLALDVIANVGPGGHFLAQKHTRKFMRTAMKRAVTHQLDNSGKYRQPREVAREKIAWILENHHPEPLEKAVRDELDRILQAAAQEMQG